MPRILPARLPEFTPDRLVERIAEALAVAREPKSLGQFPPWTQRVMRILKEQLLPREFEFLLAADQSIFAEGVAVSLAARARDVTQARVTTGSHFARQLAGRLALDDASLDVALQVEDGTFDAPTQLRAQIVNRIFSPDFKERQAFIEGLAVGNRLPELLDQQAQRGMTDATGIYLILWLYWPEIARLESIGAVARALAPFFAENKNLAGAHWDERIRKLANRIGLSFRARQVRRRATRA